ncbi:unnamed protein product, partial [Rotaria socialis]
KRPSSQKITLSEEDRKAFNELKRIHTTDLILRIPNNNLEFKLQTDAPDDGIGTVLLQTYPIGGLPLVYYSQKFSPTQKRWSTTEKECFAILSSIEKWHKYLDGQEFILETDHKPLLQLNIQAQHNAKCERWRLKLQQYRFKIKHIRGNENTMADYLSRSPIGNYQEDIDDFPTQLSKSTQTDHLRPTITTNAVTTRATTARINSLGNKDGSSTRIFTRTNHKLRVNIIRIYHDTPANGTHFGRFKTTRKIQERFYWPSITRDIRLHIRSCIPCLQNNHQRKKSPGLLKPITPPEGVWQLVAMDFHGPIVPSSREGHKYIISITDILSKYVITKAVRDCTALTASKVVIHDVILKYGTPCAILTDRGTHFTAAIMAEIFKQLGVKHIFATSYHPSTNGQIERYNATMDAKIAALSNDRRSDWNEKLPFVTFNYNTTIHATSNNIPFNMMYGRSPLLPFDYHNGMVSLPSETTYVHELNKYLSMITNNARDHILNQQTKYKIRYNSNRSNPDYKIEDIALIKNIHTRHKFDIRYEGPYRIIRKLASKTYIVQHMAQNVNKHSSNFHTLDSANKEKYIHQCVISTIQNNMKVNVYPMLQPLTSFSIYFINHTTSEPTIDYLIENATQSKVFSINTNNNNVSKMRALIQIGSVHNVSILMLFECCSLPKQDSHLF